MRLLTELALPVIAAPMAGGPSTPQLAAAVSEAGGLGFLAAGYRTIEDTAALIQATRTLTERPFGVNVFVPGPPRSESDRATASAEVARYRELLAVDAARLAVDLPQPRWDDTDGYEDKLVLMTEVEPVAAVSFTFGCPTADVVTRLHGAGTLVLVTVTDVAEAHAAAEAGADAVVVQGFEAGGHRGTHTVDATPNRLDHLALLPMIAEVGLPMVASGGITSPGDTRRALAAGAVAVQAGTAYLVCPEAGTSGAHRAGLRRLGASSVLTRAFSGRVARGLRNGFVDAHDEHAPAVFPQVDQLTKPLRAAAARAGDPDGVSLWAGAGWAAITDEPAAVVTRRLGVIA